MMKTLLRLRKLVDQVIPIPAPVGFQRATGLEEICDFCKVELSRYNDGYLLVRNKDGEVLKFCTLGHLQHALMRTGLPW